MKGKTVRVRIAVAVDEEGNWNTYGWGHADGDLGSTVSAQREMAEDGLPDINKAHHTVWIEGVVPLPLADDRRKGGRAMTAAQFEALRAISLYDFPPFMMPNCFKIMPGTIKALYRNGLIEPTDGSTAIMGQWKDREYRLTEKGREAFEYAKNQPGGFAR